MGRLNRMAPGAPELSRTILTREAGPRCRLFRRAVASSRPHPRMVGRDRSSGCDGRQARPPRDPRRSWLLQACRTGRTVQDPTWPLSWRRRRTLVSEDRCNSSASQSARKAVAGWPAVTCLGAAARDGEDCYYFGLASFGFGGQVRWAHDLLRASAGSRGQIVERHAEQIRCPRSSRAFTRRTLLAL